MQHVVLALPLGTVPAVGRGIFIWLALRGLLHTLGWALTLAIAVVVGITVTLIRRRRL